MAVLLETSKGDIVLDLLVEDCPTTCKNFLKLCKTKYYNNCLFYNVQRDFLAQTGDATNTGKGGSSVFGNLYGDQARFFDDEIRPHLKHLKKGTVAMANPGKNLNASQFYITTGDDLTSLDGKHTIFGQVAEGLDVLEKINTAFVDDNGRPFQNIRIRHTIVLDDPFDDPPELEAFIPEQSPEPDFEQGDRLEEDWAPLDETRAPEEVELETRRAEAQQRAIVLEMVGDLPDADAKPPSNMLFVCKLNPVTTEEDLEIIFGRFGAVTSCDVIRDFKTGDSLNYAFIGFDSDEACENAYFKMNNAVVDDRRIKVDFSQSVFHLWKMFKKGGRKGDAAMAKAAELHQRGGGGGGGGKPNEGNASGLPRDRPDLDLLLDEQELLRGHSTGGRAGAGTAALERRAPNNVEPRDSNPHRRRQETSPEPHKRARRTEGDRERDRDRDRDGAVAGGGTGTGPGGGGASARGGNRRGYDEEDDRDGRRRTAYVGAGAGESRDRGQWDRDEPREERRDKDRDRERKTERERDQDDRRGGEDLRRDRHGQPRRDEKASRRDHEPRGDSRQHDRRGDSGSRGGVPDYGSGRDGDAYREKDRDRERGRR